MTMFTKLLTATAVIGGLAAPAMAQTPYPYGYPQQQPAYPQPAPGQPGYGYYQPQQGYQQGYGQQGYGYQDQNGLGAIIGQLLGNRYNVSDRTAVQQCASAAMSQANAQYRQPYGNAYGYNNNRGYGQGYNQGYGANMRVTAITNVERRQSGLRVSGLIDSRGGSYPPYGQAYGYQNQGYAATGDLSFRCNVDYRGAVSQVRIRRANTYRG
jgi:hypothetical protein